MINYYKIYEGDQLFAEGTASVVAREIGCNPSLISTACSNKTLIKKRYRVEYVKKVPQPEPLYDVWDDNNLIMTGTSKEVKRAFGMGNKSSITYYIASNVKLHGKYLISHHDKEKPEDKRFNEILWHLKFYGNTVSKQDPVRYIEKLREHNIEIRVEQKKDFMDKHHRGRPSTYYILERV